MPTLSELVDSLEREGAPARAERSNIVLARHGDWPNTQVLLWCFSGGHVFLRPETRGVKPFDCDQHGFSRAAPRISVKLSTPSSRPIPSTSDDSAPAAPILVPQPVADSGGYASVRFAHDAVTVPGDVREVVNAVVDAVPTLADTITAQGGISRPLLKEAIGPTLTEYGLKSGSVSGSFGGWEIDYVSRSRALAVSVQTGRAAANNTALLALLAAAALPEVEWAILVLPHKYKGGNTFDAVANQLLALTTVRGISLSVQGAFIVGF